MVWIQKKLRKQFERRSEEEIAQAFPTLQIAKIFLKWEEVYECSFSATYLSDTLLSILMVTPEREGARGREKCKSRI